MAKTANSHPVQQDVGALSLCKTSPVSSARPVLFGLTTDQVDHLSTLRIQADALLGLLRYAGPDTPQDFLINATWLAQDLLAEIQTEIDAAVRVTPSTAVCHD